MSTGDPRRSAPKKSTTPEAAGGTDAETTEGPVGGVLPVKKAVPRANGRTGSGAAAGRAAANGTARTTAAKATKAAPAKATGTKSASAGTKSTTSSGPTTSGGRSTVTETIESGSSVFTRKSATKSSAGSRSSSALAGGKLGGGKVGGGRRLASPVKVTSSRNWGPILLYVATGVLALGIIGFGAWPMLRDSFKGTWQEQAAKIPGIVNYLDPNSPKYDANLTQRNHVQGDLTYAENPPVGGNHNPIWQNCMGDVYTSQIADEHAVHSLEHGAVWVTYRPDLPQDQIDKLASKVRNVEFMLMSPYPGLDSAISLQAWGYQLKVDNANDGRIDDFIQALRVNATQEPQAGCSGGITDATPTPLDIQGGM